MKLPKTLLHAMMVGLTVGALHSCSLHDELVEPQLDDAAIDDPVTEEKCDPGTGHIDWNCPMCGLG